MLDFLPESMIGQIAGISTSILWVATSILFTAAGKRIGPTIVNSVRIALAIIFLGSTVLLTTGTLWPDLPSQQLTFLAFSGIVGLAIGDQALFTSFIYIGPRLAILIMSTSPIWAVFFGWIFLGEQLGIGALAGIALTVAGVIWVVAERKKSQNGAPTPRSRFWIRGTILAGIGSICQAAGILLSKLGMGHTADATILSTVTTIEVEPLTATFIRMIFAALGIIPILIVRQIYISKQKHQTPSKSLEVPSNTALQKRWRAGLLFVMAGSVVGPYLGVWMSLVAADRIPLGIAQTLSSLSPVFILPIVMIIHKERLSFRAVAGSFLAVVGVGIIVLT